MILYCFLVLCVLVGFGEASREIPSYIHICKRSDPRVSRCIQEAVEVLRPQLQRGIAELDVPPIEPLRIDEIAFIRGEPPSNFQVFLRNVDVHGASEFQITKIKVNVDKNTYRVGVKFPKLQFKGDYDVDVRILTPVKGTGKFDADISNVDGQGVLKAELINTNGHREIRFTSFDFAIKVGDYNIQLDNPFNGNEVLGRTISTIIHENKKEVIQVVLPYIQKKAAEILLEAANKITVGLDYDKVFPEK